jgi:SAM-dependent methyltransferase
MPNWNDGAIVDIAARPRFHRETTPIWLATACTFLGCRAPDPSKPFRYADLGCGAGFNALIVAATCPHADVWGFDFNPVNIEGATRMAEQAGLRNVHFREISFEALAGLPPDGLPHFDFMVAETVLSVISPENQSHVQTLIARQLRPGGIACVGYHADTGWTEFGPLWTLMRLQFEDGIEASDFAISRLLDEVDRLKAGGATYLRRNPILQQRVADIRARPLDDVALELLNRDWRPLMFAEVADAMAEAKCDFLGRATLRQNILASSVPPGMLPLLEEAASIRIRETMQDLAVGTAYRRDIYRKGLAFLPVAEHQSRLEAISVAAADTAELDLPGGYGLDQPDLARYRPLTDGLRGGPLSIGHARTLGWLAGESVEAAAEAVTMLIASGHAHPMLPDLVAREAAAPVARLNDAIIDAVTRGEDINYLASPRLGTAIESNPLEILTIGALLVGGSANDMDGLVETVAAAMRSGGRSVTRDGAPVADEAEARGILRDVVTHLLEYRIPLFRSLGVLPG